MIVYKTTNLINGKIYVGKASGYNCSSGSQYLGSGKLLRSAIAKYGKENFNRKTIDIASDKNDLCLKEIFWINFYDARNRNLGYNIMPGGEGGDAKGENSRNFGKTQTVEHKSKLGISRKGSKRSDETKIKMSEIHRGHAVTEESRRKMSVSRMGRKLSSEWKKKIGISVKKQWATRGHTS